jgi:hypothetical protein
MVVFAWVCGRRTVFSVSETIISKLLAMSQMKEFITTNQRL